MGFDTNKIAVGAGECLYARRDQTRSTVAVKTATVPTTTTFIVTAAERAKIRKGDILQAEGYTPTNLVDEATTSPRITKIEASGSDYQVTVSPAFGVAPAADDALVILYHDLGATKGNIRLVVQTENEEIEIDQSIDPVAAIKRARKVMAMLPLAENGLKNFSVATGMDPAAVDDELDIGESSAGEAEYYRFLFLLPAPSKKTRFALLHRGACSGEAAMVASKTDPSVTECNVTGYPDSDIATTKNVLQIKDVTVA